MNRGRGRCEVRPNGVTVAARAPAGVLLAVLPRLSERLRRRASLCTSALLHVVWGTTVALTAGVHKGLIDRPTSTDEYLHDVHRFSGPGGLLRIFIDHIATPTGADQWGTHVGGHPPAAALTFCVLDHVGLSGGAWAAAPCIAGGAIGVPTVVAVRAVQTQSAARTVMTFLVPIRRSCGSRRAPGSSA